MESAHAIPLSGVKVFRDLTIEGPPHELQNLFRIVSERLPAGWVRDVASEDRLSPAYFVRPVYCFVSPEIGSLPKAAIWIAHRDPTRAYVTNVVPVERRRLLEDEYNAILQRFYDEVIKPAAFDLPVVVHLSQGQIALKDLLSEHARSLLDSFVKNANRTTLTAHPLDKRRWLEFVSQAHTERAPLEYELLAKWLEQEGWPEEAALELAAQYESYRELLEVYDRHQLNA